LVKRLLWLVIVVLLAAGVAAGVLYFRVNQPYQGYEAPEVFVEIPQGAGSRTIGEHLAAAGVVRDQATFRTALWMTGKGRHLQAGEYRFSGAMKPFDVIDKLARGEVFVITMTFPEGLTAAEMAKIFESHGLGQAADFKTAATDAGPIQEIDPKAPDLEGYLFPETYAVSRHTDAERLVKLMVGRFERVWTPALREAAAARQLSTREAVTLASIVEKETAKPEERPLVAAVYLNRLRIKMPLQCDPTVIYALEHAGKYTGNLRRDDLSFDSPYNTYKYPGLPPGPIASPGRASLEAAVHPADADYLYFVSRNDGSHVFARTLDEHNRNVQKYQVQYFRDQKAGRVGGAGR
jgi:peptidoglycan lytic transglycosylase G